MANNKQKLFDEFPPVSTEQWEEVIQKDLKGADYEKRLVWKTLEGLKVKPYYRQDDLNDKSYLNSLPGEFPFTRGAKTNSNEWEIRQDIRVKDVKSANEYALFILDRGVTALGFNLKGKKDDSQIAHLSDIESLLKDIHFDCIGLYFNATHNTLDIIKLLGELADKKGIEKSKITGAACYDPLGYLSIKGAWGVDENSDFNTVKASIEFAKENLPSYRVLAVNGQHFSNAGASIVQELAYTLSMIAEYMTQLSEKGVETADIAKHLQINLGVGTNYFLEIAKIRAARFLTAKLYEAYGVKNKKSNVASITSDWHNTIYDPYVNVLRTTTEAMSAVIGGTDTLVVKPFDKTYKKSNQFSDRLTRNIQIILKEESYFNKIVDPSSGSYYIENLTDSIIEETWKLFLEIDEKGGYLKALKEGIIQSKIEETATKRKNNIATRREILLGTNQYPNSLEMASKTIEQDVFEAQGVTLEGHVVKPIKKFRGAEAFEELRLATERHPKKPVLFMLTYGNLAMRKARAGFASSFFACAGYEIIDNLGFDSAEEGVNAALNANADIVVVCSSDDEYAELVPKVNELLKGKAITVVAGAPDCMDELRTKGIEDFIHVRSNVLETLQSFNKRLGIK
ncbi:MAG: methylmalonyl-CoA mutase small subunit [Bacteroidales bacterium]|nr:methylmalonyl-CoA mutase small subunit [Bacteroidales bacterium]MBN2819117.1 methylmalonyl-CoA mutase small subunit [Bacteroidales bacterium]